MSQSNTGADSLLELEVGPRVRVLVLERQARG